MCVLQPFTTACLLRHKESGIRPTPKSTQPIIAVTPSSLRPGEPGARPSLRPPLGCLPRLLRSRAVGMALGGSSR